ncbi:MAG: PCRF domain-containing protein, partial [Bacteroidales bacterium]|nr:PCRF domain-containing protein [Bacteroidales bacterium]
MSDNSLLNKLLGLRDKYNNLSEQLAQPDVVSDMKRYVALNKEYREVEPLVAAGDKYKLMLDNLNSAKALLADEKDEEMREMAKEEIAMLEETIPALEEEIKILLIPADPQDTKNAIIEIRAGTGGDEASIFAGDLFRMYAKFAERRGWKMEITGTSEGTSGGFKEVICKISGSGVYGVMKYESGV